MNPVFLLTMETRLEDLHSDMIELRNLYSSPTSSLNMVLDTLLRKFKALEAASVAGGGINHQNHGARNAESPGRRVRGSDVSGGDDGQRGAGNEGVNYQQLTSARRVGLAGNSDRGS